MLGRTRKLPPERTLKVPAWLAFDNAALSRLEARIGTAVARAQARGGRFVASVTMTYPAQHAPDQIAWASRVEGQEVFCFARPADKFTLATLGCEAVVEPPAVAAAAAVAELARECAGIMAGAQFDDPGDDPHAPSGTGPVWVGGMAFDPERQVPSEWREFGRGRELLPTISLVRQGDQARLTLCAVVTGADEPEVVIDRIIRQVERLDVRPLPMIDPDRVRKPTLRSAAPPEHYLQAIERATDLIKAREFEKIVLARQVNIDHAGQPPDAIFGALTGRFPDCFCFAHAVGDDVFLGASPELLIRREGRRATTMALAGSARRSSEPALDELLGRELLTSQKDLLEHDLVARRIERELGPLSAWVSLSEQPQLVRLQNIQHLATAVRAQLIEPRAVLELIGLLHPTPAVGGEPWDCAKPWITALEGFERGWYAGPIGWMSVLEDGEYCVALRCALVSHQSARLYAGVGVVTGSDPASELAETETKFAALTPIFMAHADLYG